MRAALPVYAVVLATTCYDPLPAKAHWLAGRWQWTGSCCDIRGQEDLPDSANPIVMIVHYNADATLIRNGDTVRTRLEVDMNRSDVVTFEYPVIYDRTKFIFTRTASDSLELADFASMCADCFSLHRFARAP